VFVAAVEVVLAVAVAEIYVSQITIVMGNVVTWNLVSANHVVEMVFQIWERPVRFVLRIFIVLKKEDIAVIQ